MSMQSSAFEAPQRDRDVIRGLASEIAAVAALPEQAENARRWQALNDLKPERPLVWINEIPWHEMEVDQELTCLCENDLLRGLERRFRTTLYQWRHMPGDMVVNGYAPCPRVWSSTGIGLDVQETTIPQNEAGGIQSHHFEAQIEGPEDIEKIRMPKVSYDEEATRQRQAFLSEVLDGVLPVQVEGVKHIWFTPWDNLIRLVDMESFMMDMIDRPDFIDGLVGRYVDAKLHELTQMEALNLFSAGTDNTRVGSGGYAYTSDLPGDDFDPEHVRPRDLWGCGNAQIFSEISPDMHWEFSLKHEVRWLKRWGLTYYGCCEPLHNKIDILRRIPNLRKISMSPWADAGKAAEQIGSEFVFSHKPSPAVLAEDSWRPQQARDNLKRVLDATRGCPVEVIMKDISTVRSDPRRLWEWEAIATELVQEYAAS